jgi:hypothetical protein
MEPPDMRLKENMMLRWKTGYVKVLMACAAVASFAVASGAGARWY